MGRGHACEMESKDADLGCSERTVTRGISIEALPGEYHRALPNIRGLPTGSGATLTTVALAMDPHTSGRAYAARCSGINRPHEITLCRITKLRSCIVSTRAHDEDPAPSCPLDAWNVS